MKEIIDIIMRRDHISELEATNAVENCREEILEAIEEGASYDEVADLLMWWLGLEPDYLEMMMP